MSPEAVVCCQNFNFLFANAVVRWQIFSSWIVWLEVGCLFRYLCLYVRVCLALFGWIRRGAWKGKFKHF